IDTGATCGFSGAGDLSNVSAGLGNLANYGGPTETHILVTGSPAIDAGRSCPPPNTDQRGVTRPKDGNGDTTAVCDIGSGGDDSHRSPHIPPPHTPTLY